MLHAIVELWGLAATPQLYAEAWYARGGAPRTIQVIASDILHPGGVVALGAALAAIFVAGPPRAWRALPARARALVAAVRRNGSTVGAIAGALLLVAILPSFEEPKARAADGSRPNVLVIAADSLRADRIVPEIAPNLAALADRSTRFDHAYVSLPRTFPSWVSILTGRHPHHHGIRNMFPRWEERAKDFDALPSRLAKVGYRTGVVSDYAGDIFGRIDLGFQDVDVPRVRLSAARPADGNGAGHAASAHSPLAPRPSLLPGDARDERRRRRVDADSRRGTGDSTR